MATSPFPVLPPISKTPSLLETVKQSEMFLQASKEILDGLHSLKWATVKYFCFSSHHVTFKNLLSFLINITFHKFSHAEKKLYCSPIFYKYPEDTLSFLLKLKYQMYLLLRCASNLIYKSSIPETVPCSYVYQTKYDHLFDWCVCNDVVCFPDEFGGKALPDDLKDQLDLLQKGLTDAMKAAELVCYG